MSQKEVISLLKGHGWTNEQAVGIAANLKHESGFDAGAVGDGGKAYGLAQWHPDRQAQFQKQYGKSIKGSTLAEQVAFLNYELREGNEKSAGNRLLAAKDAGDAAAIVSRYYERPADTEGEARKRAATAISWAGGTMPEAVAPVAPRPNLGPSVTYDWPILPTAGGVQKAATAADKAESMEAKAQRIAVGAVQTSALQGADEQSRQMTGQAVAAQEQVQADKDAAGFGAVFQTTRRDPRMQPMFTLLDSIHGSKETPPEGWSYAAQQDEIEAGYSDEERAYLRENVTGPQSLAAARGQLEYRRGLDKTYANASGFVGFAGQMAGGAMDPLGFALGLGVGKAMQGVGIGSRALAAAGRTRAAGASFLAENALANVSVEVMQDALGEVKTTGDYAMAAATGVIMGAPFTRGAIRQGLDDAAKAIAKDLKTRGVEHQVDAIAREVAETGITDPAIIARRIEEKEINQIAEAVQTKPAIRDQIVPEKLVQEQRDEFDGKPAKATEATDANLKPDEFDAMFGKQKPEVTVAGMKVRPAGKQAESVGSLVDSLKASANPTIAAAAEYLGGIISKAVSEVPVLRGYNPRGAYFPDRQVVRTLEDGVSTQAHQEYVSIHEAVHAATWGKLESVARGDRSNAALTQAYDGIENLRKRLADHIKAVGGDMKHGAGYATQNVHEFAAQVLSDDRTRLALANMPGATVNGYKAPNALFEFMARVAEALGIKAKGNALEEAVMHLDNLLREDVSIKDMDGGAVVSSAVAPQQQAAFSRRFAETMFNHAKDYIQRNPIDTKRLKVLTAKIGGMSDGLVLAASKNPIMQMVASLVAETTTGAAGRKATVAIRAHMLDRKYMGNALPEYQGAFDVWANQRGTSIWDKAVGGDAYREFGKQVYTETLNRRLAGYIPNPDQSVVKAADALEGVFQRAADGQRDGGTLGANNLPATSRGYMPQALDGAKLQTLDDAQLQALHDTLSAQFQSRLGWDKRFADTFAPYYTQRVRKRAQGSKGYDAIGAGGDSNQVVRDTLEDMATDPALRDLQEAANAAKLGMGHTKKRLDLDLQTEFMPGQQLLDLYVTDPVALARNYSRRNGGNVALAESGVLGIRGVQQLRDAAGEMFEAGTQTTLQEFEAFDRVMAEIMGTPVAGRVVSAGATNLALAVQLSKLGGLVFTQAAETMQLIHTLGVGAAVNGIGSLPRMLGEVGRLKKGGASNNHILTSIEAYGGEFGMESYKMVAPLDPPDNSLNQYMDQAGLATRLLRAGGHLQSKISGFRGLMAAQHRMAAEQVVMKAARYIRDGGDDIALRDMGFTDEMVQALRQDLPHVAAWDARGNLQSFDLTRVSDAATAEAFAQAVHRGVSQIIQGTFAGERNKWFHNDYLKLMLQLRTFGLTATEKQWGRTASNHGTMYAVGALLGQMAMVLPIHAARVHMAAQGREDKEDYIKTNMNPVALARATMNYSSLSGLMGDVVDAGTGIWAGWGDDGTKELLGARQQASGVGNIIPALGMADAAIKTATGKGSIYNTMKQLPFGSLWYMVPIINLAKEE